MKETENYIKMEDGDALLLLRGTDGVHAHIGPADPKRFGAECKPLTHIERHSPDGFEYGYAGSGPNDLSLSVLTACIGPKLADLYYNQFTHDIIANVRREDCEWLMTHASIMGWVDKIANHRWIKREITKGRDAGAALPDRCDKCGQVRRPDGRHAPCPKGKHYSEDKDGQRPDTDKKA